MFHTYAGKFHTCTKFFSLTDFFKTFQICKNGSFSGNIFYSGKNSFIRVFGLGCRKSAY